MHELISRIANDCTVPTTLISSALANAHSHVKLIKIPKRNGEFRHAFQPSSKLKIVQYWIIDTIIDKIKPHTCCAAFIHGSSIKANAKKHSQNKYIIRMDLKDFFPSIKFDDFSPHLKKWCASQTDPTLRNFDNISRLVSLACFFRQKTLPVGYPTSPAIANVVMLEFDSRVEKLLNDKFEPSEVSYTRYADDMVFSTNVRGRCKEIENYTRNIIESCDHPKIQINSKKTNYMSRNGGSAIITGVLLRRDSTLTLPRTYKDKVRLMLSRASAGKGIKETNSQVLGHLNHIRDIDPSFYTALISKYFSFCREIIPKTKSGTTVIGTPEQD